MVTKSQLLKQLPPFRNSYRLVNYRQSTDEIINEIALTQQMYEADYDAISELFDTGDVYTTCKKIWEFLKFNIPYNIESDVEQTVKSPTAILQDSEKVDCKNYSLFIGGVLDSIRRNNRDTWEWVYRFASYTKSKNVQHVFVVVKDGNREIWIDPVLRSFDEHKQPNNYIDKSVMALYSVSGIGDASGALTVTVSKAKAESSFLIMVNNNIMNLKTLLLDNPDILYGNVQTYFLNQGFDFPHLLQILNVK